MTSNTAVNSKPERIFIGIAWPYANNELHLGHFAGCLLPADILARYHRQRGNEVLMVSGSDCHGTPITVAAEAQKLAPRELVNNYHEKFIESFEKVGITFDLFTQTMTENHFSVVHDVFKRHQEKGLIYTEVTKQLYDPQAKRFLPDRYVEGTCPHCGFADARGDQCDNCGKTYEAIELKNPRSKVSGSKDLEIRDTEHFFLERELRGRAITRDLDWGVTIPVAGYEGKRLYVWYEAVIGYLSASKEYSQLKGKPDLWKSFLEIEKGSGTKTYYFIGKDNTTFHAIMWPAMILGYGGLNTPYDVPANEFLNSYGRKLSKSRGTAVFVLDFLERYQSDALRYVLTAIAPETADSDFTWDDFLERVNSELVANWGNLANRVLGFSAKRFDGVVPNPGVIDEQGLALLATVKQGFETVGDLYAAVKLRSALEEIRGLSQKVNQYLSEKIPWTLIKTDPAASGSVIYVALQCIDWLKTMWAPILPESSQAIHSVLGYNGQLAGTFSRQTVTDSHGPHLTLQYDHSQAIGKWEASILKPGTKMGEITAPFKKLDEAIVDLETANQPS